MFRVLVVCMGNICRSPMAASVLQGELERRGLLARVEVDSAGTHGAHAGERADRRAVQLTSERGYPQILRERSRRIADADFERFDLILAMDRHNLARLRDRCPPAHQHKLHLFLAYAGQDEAGEVPDPYYGPQEGFEVVLKMIERAVPGVIERLPL